MRIDLNCDMGEDVPGEERTMPLVTSVNVSCGVHAGGPATMRRTVRLASRHGVAVGAHPSFPDRAGFGRRFLAATPDEIRDDVTYQIGALWGFCQAEGVRLTHVKAHGALYDVASKDREIAAALCEAARSIDPRLAVVCLAGSPMVEVARALRVPCVEEAFADRAYTSAGTLVPRRDPGAVLRDPEDVAERVSRLVQDGYVRSIDGAKVRLRPGTVCVHGDTPGAEHLVGAIRERLRRDGVDVRAFSAGG